jgi:hypothetical protein
MDDDAPATKRDLELTKQELHQAIQDAVKQVTDSLTELIRDTETKMLKAFHGYATGTAARFQRTEIS